MRAPNRMDFGALQADDVRLIRALQLDPRAPFTAIGRVLGRSETSVRRRYQRLRADGVVRVAGVVDPGGLGLSRWLLRLRCRPGGAAAIGDALARRDDVSWVATVAAGAEVTCWVRSVHDRDREDLIGRLLPHTAAVTGIDASVMLHQFLGGRAHHWQLLAGVLTAEEEAALSDEAPFTESPAVASDPVRLDESDSALLAVLVEDGRASATDLAAAAGLSPGQATRRLDRLLEAGAAHVDIEISPHHLRLEARANLWLRVHPSALREAGRALAREPRIAFAAAVSGVGNLHAVAHCRTYDELYRLTSDTLGTLPGVEALEVSPILTQVKQASTRVSRGRLVVGGVAGGVDRG